MPKRALTASEAMSAALKTDRIAGAALCARIYCRSVETVWSMLNRAHMDTFHKISQKRPQLYRVEFCGRNNVRKPDSPDQMRLLAVGLGEGRLTWMMLAGTAGRAAAA